MSKARELANLGNAYDDGALSNRNMVVNGDMKISQRGTSVSSVTGSAYHCCDRFYTVANALGTWTVSQASDGPSGFSNSLKYECTTADASPAAADYFVLQTRMEGQNLQQIAKGTSDAKPIALSFWVKSNVTGTYALYLRDIDNNRGVGANYTVSSSGTWEYKTVIIPADTTGTLDNDNDLSFSLEWWLGSGTDYSSGTMPTTWGTENTVDRNAGSTVNVGDTIGNTWQITGVQLEIGDSSTPFEHRSYADQLQACQRYYQRWSSDGAQPYFSTGRNHSGTVSIFTVNYRTEMRGRPSLSISAAADIKVYDGYDRTCTGVTLNGNALNTCGFNVNGLSSGVGNNYAAMAYFISTSGYFALDAEL